MRLLVAGGAGYLGSVLTSQLRQAGHPVVLGDLSPGDADAVPEGAHKIQGRIQDVGTV